MKHALSGLIIKDFMLFKQFGLRFVFFIIAFYIAIPLIIPDAIHSVSTLAGILCILFALLPISTFSYDENANWDRYALSMPITREMIVLGKYLFTGIMVIIGGALMTLYLLIFGFFRSPEIIPQIFFGSIGYIGTSILSLCILLPVIFKFGPEKGRLSFMAVAVIIMASAYLFQDVPVSSILSLSYLIPILLIAICVYVSYLISLRIFCNKEIQ